jgi:hypothetical protein
MGGYFIMTTRIVKQDGSGDYTNIADALAVCDPYDIVEIQDSETYNEENLSRIKAGLTIKAGTGFTPILDGAGILACAIKFYNFWRMEGLTITNYTGTGENGAGLVSVSSFRQVTIIDCVLHNLPKDAITDLKNGSIVENCTIYNIHSGGTSRGIDGGSQGITVNQCLLYDISGDGIYSTPASTEIRQCTLYNVGYSASAGSYGILATLGTIQYCIVSDPNHYLGSAGIRATTHSYNCVSGSDGSTHGNFYGGTGTGDTESDPLIVSSSMRLGPGSPCIGTAVGSTRPYDIVSGSRDWNYNTSNKVMGVNTGATPYDMGALEFTYTAVNGVDTKNISKIMGVS